MLCSTCLGANMKDAGDYYQCPRCSDIRPKCGHDRGVERFKQICLSKRQPTQWDKVKTLFFKYHWFVTTALMLSVFILVLMLLQIQKGGI